MADNGIMCKNADIVAKAGVGVNATIITADATGTDGFVLMVEAFVNCFTQKNWSDIFLTLSEDVAEMLTGVCADICAIYCIQWDMTGYNSIREAESMINVLTNRANQQLGILRDKEVQAFMLDAEGALIT